MLPSHTRYSVKSEDVTLPPYDYLERYLTGRLLYVDCLAHASKTTDVPQGSVLGPANKLSIDLLLYAEGFSNNARRALQDRIYYVLDVQFLI